MGVDRMVIVSPQTGAGVLVLVVQQGLDQEPVLDQELDQERTPAGQISEQIEQFGAFKASIIYFTFILRDCLPRFEANFLYFYRK